MTNKNTKTCSTSLAVSEVQIKTRRGYYLPSRKAKMKNTNYTKCWQGCKEIGPPLHCHWECEMIQLP